MGYETGTEFLGSGGRHAPGKAGPAALRGRPPGPRLCPGGGGGPGWWLDGGGHAAGDGGGGLCRPAPSGVPGGGKAELSPVPAGAHAGPGDGRPPPGADGVRRPGGPGDGGPGRTAGDHGAGLLRQGGAGGGQRGAHRRGGGSDRPGADAHHPPRLPGAGDRLRPGGPGGGPADGRPGGQGHRGRPPVRVPGLGSGHRLWGGKDRAAGGLAVRVRPGGEHGPRSPVTAGAAIKNTIYNMLHELGA